LFKDNPPGKYEYSSNKLGKCASGQLTLNKGKRNPTAQKTVGGVDRKDSDDGGHLIATIFGGSGEWENLEAQASNLNRGAYLHSLEKHWKDELGKDSKIFVKIDTFKSNSSDRPDCFEGYCVIEDKNGKRRIETFSYQNEDRVLQDDWAKDVNDTDIEYDQGNPIGYNPTDYIAEISDNEY